MSIRGKLTSASTFAAELKLFGEFVEEEVLDVSQHIALYIWESLWTLTPRLSGRAQNSWNFSYDTIDTKVPAIGSYSDPTPPVLKGKNLEFDKVFMTSNLDYIIPLEFGHSAKGERMVEKTMHALDFAIPTIIGGRQNV